MLRLMSVLPQLYIGSASGSARIGIIPHPRDVWSMHVQTKLGKRSPSGLHRLGDNHAPSKPSGWSPSIAQAGIGDDEEIVLSILLSAPPLQGPIHARPAKADTRAPDANPFSRP
jgi:hypothetical protein